MAANLLLKPFNKESYLLIYKVLETLPSVVSVSHLETLMDELSSHPRVENVVILTCALVEYVSPKIKILEITKQDKLFAATELISVICIWCSGQTINLLFRPKFSSEESEYKISAYDFPIYDRRTCNALYNTISTINLVGYIEVMVSCAIAGAVNHRSLILYQDVVIDIDTPIKARSCFSFLKCGKKN